MKKIFISLSVLTALTACGGKTETSTTKKQELTMMVNFDNSQVVTQTLENIIREFEKQNPGITVDFTGGSSGYEALLKTKMATKQLPDLWATHGWSKGRYFEYLENLQNQEWVKNLHPAIKQVVTDKNGEVWALPLDVDMAGIAYNKTLVDKVGINVDDIKTWDDLLKSMQILKDNGITPVTMGGKDDWTVGNFYDWIAPAAYVMSENNQITNLLSGNFDSEKWTQISTILKEMKDKEYLNKDAVTSGYSETARALGEGKAAYAFLGNYVNMEALSYNKDAKVGFFPIPALNPQDKPYLISGERTAIGVWRDSPNKDAAMKLLNFLALPENIEKVATANSLPPGLTNAKSNAGILSADYEKYQDIQTTGYFDREYLPNGMWDTIAVTGVGIISGGMTPEQVSKEIDTKFKQLYKK